MSRGNLGFEKSQKGGQKCPFFQKFDAKNEVLSILKKI